MKESLILSLLLISVFSDDSYYPPNMPQELYDQMKMREKCQEAKKDEDQCLATTLSDSYFQCCVLTIEYPYIIEDNKNYEKSCFIMYKEIKYLQEVYNSVMFKATTREMFGYLRYGLYYIDDDGERFYIADDDSFKMKQIYKCNDGTAEYSYGYEEYTQTDISVFDSGSHCLKYFYRYMYSEEYDENNELTPVSKNDCLNAQLTQTALDAGVKCGFFQFNINFVQGGAKTYQTCYLYNTNFISDKKLDEKTQSELQAYVAQIGYKEGNGAYSSYTTQFSDESGNTYTFDMTGQFTQPSSISNLLSLSKYIYLLLVLFMM